MSGSATSRAAVVAVALGVAGLTVPQPAAAVTPAFPCLREYNGLGFFTSPPLAPGGTSTVQLLFQPAPPEGQLTTRLISRLDGSQRHEASFESRLGSAGGAWVRTDSRAYRSADLGTWILYDENDRPWQRFSAKAGSWFSSITGPGRIVTAGETVGVAATLKGWTAAETAAPVVGMPVTVRSVNPAGAVDATLPRTTSSTGRITAALRLVSNRTVRVSSSFEGCYTHAGTGGPALNLLVRKRITATPADTTPTVGGYVKVSGTVYPAKANQPVYLQRWDGTRFVTIVTGSTTGAYTFYYRPANRGSHVLRVSTPYDAWHVTSASANIYLQAG